MYIPMADDESLEVLVPNGMRVFISKDEGTILEYEGMRYEVVIHTSYESGERERWMNLREVE